MRFWTQSTVQIFNGGVAYTLSNKQELIKMCLTSFLSSDFYEKDISKIERIQDLASKIDPHFCMKLAIFSREYGLRSVNHVLFVESAKRFRYTDGVRKILTNYLDKIVRRPDELLEIVGYYAQREKMNMNSIILPNSLKIAIKNKLEKFNDYQLAKYRGKGDAINLFDLVNMVHAWSPSIDKLMTWVLESADTWEVEISENGNNKESWLRLICENKLGALATIRNLRNIIQSGVKTAVIAHYLDTIKWSDIFPFQAIQALDMVYQIQWIDDQISNVIQKHVRECFQYIAEKYKGKVAIGIDVSGSMFGATVSKLSKLDRAKMALSYGVLLKEIMDADLFVWADKCIKIDGWEIDLNELYAYSHSNSWWTIVSSFTSAIGTEYDYCIILTDEQISDRLVNVAKVQTIVWGLHDMENTIASGNGITYFTWYNDIMWKIGSDMFRLGEIEQTVQNL